MPIEKETFVSTYLVAEEGLSQGITTPASYCFVESLCVSAKTKQFQIRATKLAATKRQPQRRITVQHYNI